MLIILCGQIDGSDEWKELPQWPLQPHGSTDEYNLNGLTEYLGMNAKAFGDLKHEALRLTLEREYRMLQFAVTGMPDYTPRIGPELLARLHRIATREVPWNRNA